MVLDTGSSHTIVKPNIVAHCRIQNLNEEYQLETASGEIIPAKGVHLAICDHGIEEDETVIVEPKTESLLHHRGILTGRTLTVKKDHRMVVRIMNLKDYPQQILKGEPIGICQTAEVVAMQEEVLKLAQMKTLPEPLQEIIKKSKPLLNTEEVLQRTKLDGPEEWGADTLAREQREDPDVGDIVQWKIEGKERPAWQEISNRSPTFKGYWALWDSLAIENNLLKRVWETYRSAVHESTGKTPASVLFGAELRLPIDLISDRPKQKEGVDNYISHLQDRLKLTHAEVRQKMRIESDRMKTRYDLRANTGGVQVGEKVWLYNPKRTKGKSPKLQKSWEGPYIIVTRLNDVVYRIQKNPQAKMKIVHIDRLTPYQEPHPNEGFILPLGYECVEDYPLNNV
ncbi:hypothetical protein NQ315_014856 [Exocentrus adspersus]|uniref:Integrase p58-like C-terminal domain-containing protein n=1 Tax=Exocentrus adspersus TaxID=1586481 RepID=A0AAV8VKT7_9CUCU|nr:hypothetical protein NQ315_014856 [Exocentrus adspersus]